MIRDGALKPVRIAEDNDQDDDPDAPQPPRKRTRTRASQRDPIQSIGSNRQNDLIMRCSATLREFNNQAVLRCHCDLEASPVVARQGNNSGRTFYACPKESRRARCNFFKWSDDTEQHLTTSNSSRTITQTRRSLRSQTRRTASKSRGSRSGATKSQECYKCGQTGHWANNCTSGT